MLRTLIDSLLEPDDPAEVEEEPADGSDGESARREDLGERARQLARSAMANGWSLEECLDGVRSLHDPLFHALGEEIGKLDPVPSPREIVGRAQQLSTRLHRVSATCSRMYLREVADETEEKLDAFVDFTRAVRHELKDKLGAAYTSARLLHDEEVPLSDGDRRRVVESIPRNVRRALDLLEGVRALFRLDDEEESEQVPWLELEKVIRETVRDLTDPAETTDVEIRVEGECPPVRVDARRTRLILHNLVGNAIKYSDDGKEERWVRVEAHLHRTAHGTSADADGSSEQVLLRVLDNGVGIAPEDQDRVFDRFYRSGGEGKEGSGIGLALAQVAVSQLGGEIRLESEHGTGSAFSVLLPCERDAEGPPPE